MFEKYNEKARRALFFARYEASKLGSRVIESEHILLGILREGEETVSELFRRLKVKPGEVRREIEGERVFVERISSTAELPLSNGSPHVSPYLDIWLPMNRFRDPGRDGWISCSDFVIRIGELRKQRNTNDLNPVRFRSQIPTHEMCRTLELSP